MTTPFLIAMVILGHAGLLCVVNFMPPGETRRVHSLYIFFPSAYTSGALKVTSDALQAILAVDLRTGSNAILVGSVLGFTLAILWLWWDESHTATDPTEQDCGGADDQLDTIRQRPVLRIRRRGRRTFF